VLDRDLEAEALEVDDGGKDGDRGDEVHDVGQAIAVEGLLEGARLVVPGEEEVEEGDDGALELWSTARVDRRRRKGLPDDRLANVGGDEERNARAEAIASLEELIEEDDEKGGDDELDDEQEADAIAEVLGLAVETAEDVDEGLTKGDEQRKDCRHMLQ
jgi:hypothetical protein